MTRYEIQLAPQPKRALAQRLPLAAAFAIDAFIQGPLRENPRRVGKPLTRELSGRFSARRGDYRVIYSIDDDTRTVRVSRIEHRSDVYRSR